MLPFIESKAGTGQPPESVMRRLVAAADVGRLIMGINFTDEYIRFLDDTEDAGGEIVYWDAQEFRDDPTLIGRVIGQGCRWGASITIEDDTPEAVATNAPAGGGLQVLRKGYPAKGRQSVDWKSLWRLDGTKVLIEIHRDSHDAQSHARASVWSENLMGWLPAWHLVHDEMRVLDKEHPRHSPVPVPIVSYGSDERQLQSVEVLNRFIADEENLLSVVAAILRP